MAFMHQINQQRARVEVPMDWRCPVRLTSFAPSINLNANEPITYFTFLFQEVSWEELQTNKYKAAQTNMANPEDFSNWGAI